MYRYIEGTPRRQLYLFNECLDELVGEESIVRFIDAYVEMLDMGALGFRMHDEVTGAPAYRPQAKLKIYVYGYFEKVRTSRKLEKECMRNKEMIWLTEGLAPDFKTIADFRKDNYRALKKIFKEFLKLCYRLNLITFGTVAIDGSKLRGQNSLNEIYSRERMDKIEKEIQEKIDRYLHDGLPPNLWTIG
jgi:transposase